MRKTAACCCFPLGYLAAGASSRPTHHRSLADGSVSFAWVVLVTGWIQPMVDSSLSDRFCGRSSAIWWMTSRAGTVAVLYGPCLRQPTWRCSRRLVSPPGATLGFVLALSLPLSLVPLFSVDAALLMLASAVDCYCSPMGRIRPCPLTLRYCWLWCPASHLGAVLWWQRAPGGLKVEALAAQQLL